MSEILRDLLNVHIDFDENGVVDIFLDGKKIKTFISEEIRDATQYVLSVREKTNPSIFSKVIFK